MTRALYATTVGCLLVLSLLTSSGILGAGSVASAISEKDEKPNNIHHGIQNFFETRNVGTCPSQNFLVGPNIDGANKILDIKYTAQNDEDSGIDGYWALDHLVQHLKVWQLPNGTFYALKTYNGIFIVPQGGPNPAGLAHNQTESAFGIITGGYVGTFTGTFTPGSQPTSGNIGIFNYGGTTSDVLLGTYGNQQKGSTSAYDFTTTYFTGVQNFNQPHWGWSYKLDPLFQSDSSANQWCNYNPADGGNSGNIET